VSFAFVAGNLALDFVATVAERETTAVERVPTPGDLARWFVDAGVVDEPPAADARGLAEAVALREAVWRSLRAMRDGRPPSAADRRLLNDRAAASPPAPEVAADGSVGVRGDLDACLAAVARAAAEALRPAVRDRIKWCEGERCTRAFVDSSRAGNRRWCGMAGCGDRAKAAAYRARRRVAPRA
jgi:predicted RNA-binding Zn ribbon-like protein